ncbi:MAG: response regulator [Spirochaetales bacterium]|nr:response regulator [Spirochaetales bacterium]
MSKKILAIDDEVSILEALKTILDDMGYLVTTFSNSIDGESAALTEDYDLILCDMRMPERNGAEVTRNIMAKKPNARILIITAFPGDPLARQSLDAGAKGLVKKPFEIGKILSFLREG